MAERLSESTAALEPAAPLETAHVSSVPGPSLRPRRESRFRSFGGKVVLTTGANVVIGLIGLATGILAARLLGPEGRGELAAIQTWPTCIATIGMMGIPEALVFFSARERTKAGAYFASGAAFLLVISAVFVIAGAFAMPLLLARHSAEVISGARWYLLSVPIFGVLTLALCGFRSVNLAAWNLWRSFPALSWLAVLLLALVFNERHPVGLAVYYLLALVPVTAAVVFLLARDIGGAFRPEGAKIKAMLHFGVPSIMSTVPQVLNMRLDQLLMATLLPAESLGLYVVAVAWGNIASPIQYGLSGVLFPHIASIHDSQERKEAFALGSRMGFLLCLCVGCALACVTPLLLPIAFGKQFAPVVATAVVLVAAASVSGFNLILEEGLRGLGHPKAAMFSEFGGLFVTAAILIVLLSRLGTMGAALACLGGYSTVCILLLVLANRAIGTRYSQLLRPSLAEVSLIYAKLRHRHV